MIAQTLLAAAMFIPPSPANAREMAFCRVEAVLRAIHAMPWRPPPNDRYLILHSIKDDGQRYVQCLFKHRDHDMICEASSGYFDFYSLHMSPTRWVAIGRAGFGGDGTKGNFHQKIAAPTKDYHRVAALMIDTIRTGYGIEADDIGIKAGLIDVTAATLDCYLPGPELPQSRFEP